MTQVTFQDRLKFDAFCSHVANPSRRVTELMISRQPMPLRTESDKIWRAVDFSPRYHQVRLSSPKMDFSRCRCLHKRAESAKSEVVNRARLEELLRERKKREEYLTWKTRAELGKFYAKFPPLVPRDEREANQRAKMWRLYVTYPYKNPKPFDHRGLDLKYPQTRLNTVKTPDLFLIRLKTEALTDRYKQCYTDPDLSYGTRNINFKFRTVKTPELRYDPRLLMHKGRYSPAFSAYEAYLSRVYKNITS